jgi:hypothetical protein
MPKCIIDTESNKRELIDHNGKNNTSKWNTIPLGISFKGVPRPCKVKEKMLKG